MNELRQVKTALISVFHKDGLKELIALLDRLNVKILSTGGTLQFIESCGVKATPVDDLTGYPSLLGGRVKT
ncbi:MAG: IMP cyclohydrolase, partial [Tenuifilaceae bacterium]